MWYKRAADTGDGEAAYNVSTMYTLGYGRGVQALNSTLNRPTEVRTSVCPYADRGEKTFNSTLNEPIEFRASVRAFTLKVPCKSCGHV